MAFTPTDPLKAEVRVVGTAPNQQLDFYIPRGPKGDPGGFAAATSLGTSDLNSIVIPGLYRQSLSTNATAQLNYPSASSGLLEVFEGQNAADLIQRFTPWGGVPAVGRIVYIRRRDAAGVWSTWNSIASSRVDQTAGRVVYEWDAVNNRDQLIYGDTGWRQIIAVGDIATLPNMQGFIRRNGNIVTFMSYETTAGGTASGPTSLYVVPVGFRFVLGASPAMVSGSVIDSGAVPVANASIYLASAGTYTVTLRAVAGVRHYTTISWPTSESWPTTLPGTAYGTIPNL